MSRDFSETYYRKRFRKPLQQSNNYEMECMKKKAQVTFGDSVPQLSNHSRPIMLNAQEMNITAGAIYEIAHVHLPTRTPVNLRSVRVAMVSEKTDVTVAIKYPSMESLGKYFSKNRTGLDAYPEMDENFVMGIGLAARVLLRKVPFQECGEKKQFLEFWLLGNDGSKKGYCGLFDEINGNGMLRWGTRRRVRFLDKHSEPTNTITPIDHSTGFEVARVELIVEKEGESMEEDEEENDNEEIEEENKVDEGEKEEEEDEDDDENEAVKEEEGEDESDEEDEEVVMKDTKVGVKRKRYDFRASVRQPKKVKREKQTQKQQKKTPPRKQNKCRQLTVVKNPKNKCRQLTVLKNPKDRWSSERYKSAEKSLWEVMKAKGAMAYNPILRPALRVEARKKIGDTGLLDHLLKHMAGKVAPCGTDRFRRRHNAEGQMEYWLESANLFDIRKQAGVIDPYWIPPPGWELGDSVTQDPIFAKELKLLKEEILEVKRYAKKKQSELEEEVRKLRSEMKDLKPKKKKGESQAIVVSSNPCGGDQLMMSQLANTSACAILDLNKAPEQEKNKEQQMNISDFVKELQKKLGKLESEMAERNRSNSALMVPSESFCLNEKKQVGEVEQHNRRGKEGQRIAAVEGSEVKTHNLEGDKEKAPKAEKAKTTLASGEGSEKAARIEKLRSGFRICKPQGTFLWPSMMTPTSSSPSSQQLQFQMEDLILVPTPPSISLTPPRLPYQHHQAPQLVKPLAERHRGFTVTAASTVSESTTYDEETATTNTTITTTTVMPHHFMGSANEEEIELLK